jgi:hypothetical protein
MTAFRIAGFSGSFRDWQTVVCAQPGASGDQLQPDLRGPASAKRVETGVLPVIDGDIVSMFRIEKDGSEKWFAWTRDVDVARSPIAGNTDKRFY